jgi:hypothetical protein
MVRDASRFEMPCHLLRVVVLVVGLVWLAGCAGTAGTARAVDKGAKPSEIARFKSLSVQSSANSDLNLSVADQERIVKLVQAKIVAREANRFANVGALPTDPGALHQVKIGFTRYDEGNAFARFILAGLGQIHIDADVVLVDPATQKPLGTYLVTKTFAWGGIYGGVTSIKDVEAGFADAVADVVLGKAEEPAKPVKARDRR